ncbi:hypothetical protein K437DRAFT_269465 [Tilletiaria anomala UBC 951]|uniref:Uncharacterized protein n=1 Tax=Tilletiaria anomala (strain ATCC 24038 / CBS 436.72 / UBC 951) TaxID=1037660 RepID=A0A066VL29_TILAU|nr:uncharacterized protein K437DRAFT_269465 [Tilletiaria anomala UBC 951]KDN42191.1 hypothetical protein K437DRAFT_269465 [Tilletiaria anomala UBC 951]
MEASAFDTPWFLLPIPIILLVIAIVLITRRCSTRNRKKRQRRFILRNVTPHSSSPIRSVPRSAAPAARTFSPASSAGSPAYPVPPTAAPVERFAPAPASAPILPSARRWRCQGPARYMQAEYSSASRRATCIASMLRHGGTAGLTAGVNAGPISSNSSSYRCCRPAHRSTRASRA